MPCPKFSTECGADAWLQFTSDDPPEYQALNGQCVVIVGTEGDQKVTDTYDPLQPNTYNLLKVHPSKLNYG